MSFYKNVEYLVYDDTARPFRVYYSSKWWAYKTYNAMIKAVDEYLKIKMSYEA